MKNSVVKILKTFLFTICLFVNICSVAIAQKCDFIQYNKCVSCDSLYVFEVGSDETCSYLCPNREINYVASRNSFIVRNCALKNCPNNAPFKSKYGNCFVSKADAENDLNNVEYSNFNNENIQTGSYATAPVAKNGKCPKNLPLLYAGKCFSCDETDDLSIPELECKKCTNRTYKNYPNWSVNSCELITPKDKPLERWDGYNFSCNESQAIRIKTHCNLEKDCEDVCPNRTILYRVGGNVPSVLNCPKDKPLMDSQGICFACNTPIAIGLDYNTRLCHQFCANSRHLIDSKCVLND